MIDRAIKAVNFEQKAKVATSLSKIKAKSLTNPSYRKFIVHEL